MTESPPCSDSRELCLRCGLCCDGSLFGRVQIHSDESKDRLRSAGMVIAEDEKHGAIMPQPCAQFCHGRCQAYADRPRQCRTFVCQSLARFEGGEISRSEALDLVQSMREHRRLLDELIKRHLPEFAEKPLREVLKEIGRLLKTTGNEAANIQRRHGELLVQAIAFRRFRTEHFRLAELE